MKITFLSTLNPYDIRYWSGSLFSLYQFLSKQNDIVWLSGDLVNGGLWFHRFWGKQEQYYPENYVLEFGRIQSSIINQGNLIL
ncbi:hypothetical protein IX296_002651 [Bacteroides pyogenes]|nr:hypothetical protein [Bacteroides pyogenes]MBR8810339.1 hypothetical protein [Bacteroides pyogenes]